MSTYTNMSKHSWLLLFILLWCVVCYAVYDRYIGHYITNPTSAAALRVFQTPSRKILDNTSSDFLASKNASQSDSVHAPWNTIYDQHSWDLSKLSAHSISVSALQSMCNATFWNALQSTVYHSYIDNTTFVITGDIEDMWIRDSTEQIWPYFPLMSHPQFGGYIRRMIRGTILKQAQFVVFDVYTNAFRKEPYCFEQKLKLLIKTSLVATRDHEIDSGAYFIKLLYQYYIHTHDTEIFFVEHKLIKRAIDRLLEMWKTEQHHAEKSKFVRIEHLNNVSYTGMIWTSHRPSDDVCTYPYHIADNFFVYQTLEFVKYFVLQIYRDDDWNTDEILKDIDALQQSIWSGIHTYGVTQVGDGVGEIYCYEADDQHHCNLMDDANVPSLLSIPLITNFYNKTIYENTRKWLLSDRNPYFYANEKQDENGVHVRGIGSPHTPKKYIWPIALVTQGFTTDDEAEKYEILKMLMETTGDTGLMHESFKAEDHYKYTRKFFSWANSYFSVYANCLQQFMDWSEGHASVVTQKQESDKYIGSLSSIREVFSEDVQEDNPKFAQWIKLCEPEKQNKFIDTDRMIYKTQVFNSHFLTPNGRKQKTKT